MDGRIDDVRIYNRSLSASEILAVMGTNNGFGFNLTTNPTLGTVQQNQGIQTTITITRTAGTSASVNLQASGLSGTQGSFSFSPTSCTPNPSCTSTLTITTLGAIPVATYPLTVTGAAGSLVRTTPFTLTIQSGVPSTPSNLGVTPLSSTQLRLNWSRNSSNEQGFNIEYRLTSGSTWLPAGTVAAGITTFPHTNLTANTSYSYRVRAYNLVGNSAWSPVAQGTTNGGGISMNEPVSPTVTNTGIQTPVLTSISPSTIASNQNRSIDFYGSSFDFPGATLQRCSCQNCSNQTSSVLSTSVIRFEFLAGSLSHGTYDLRLRNIDGQFSNRLPLVVEQSLAPQAPSSLAVQ